MKVGVFTAMMVEGRVFDGTGRKLPPDQYIEQIAAAGYRGIEWGIADSYALTPAMAERDAQRLSRLGRDYGLKTVAVASSAVAHDLDAVQRMLDIAASFHAPALRIGLRAYDPGKNYGAQVKRCGEDLAGALHIARSYKIRLVLEIHFGFLLPSPSLAQRFISQFEPAVAGIIFDPGNMVVEGGEPWPLSVEILGDYLDHVHVKNLQWTWTNLDWKEHPTRHKHWQWQLAPLDKGQVNWPQVIAALRRMNYRGWLTLEDFSTRPLKQKLRDGHRFLTRLLTETKTHP